MQEKIVPIVYPRSEHNISRAQISGNALKVLYRLKNSGYQAYLVGGCVRDLLLGREPKDFDVVTDAYPNDVKRIFRNCRLIGRRFRLAHIHFGRDIVEVATFRSSGEGDRVVKDGRLIRDNVYGTLAEDVWRRDFSVNALYYNIRDFSVIDYVGGMDDHKIGTLRVIGNPMERYREDPVRMLRAIRFATKLGFTLHPSCEQPIKECSSLLGEIPSARLYDEVLKLFFSGFAVQTFEQLRHYHLFEVLFPETEKCLATEEDGFPLTFLAKALANTDSRIAEGKTVTPYFLFAAFLWEPLRVLVKDLIQRGSDEFNAIQEGATEVFSQQIKLIAFPRRDSVRMRELWNLQPRFNKRVGKAPFRLLSHPRFRAAYDFLVLRSETGEIDPALAEWWTVFQEASELEQREMTRGVKNRPRRRRRNK